MILRFPAILAAAIMLSGFAVLAEDSSTFFLKAYQDYQSGEKLERDGRLRDALNAYASTVAILEKIRKDDPSWQEIVVNFRMRKAKENIERLRLMLATEPEKLPPHKDPLPARGFEIDIPEPAVSTRPRQVSAKPVEALADVAGERIASLERQVALYKQQLAEQKDLREKLEGERSLVKTELDRTKTALVDANSRLSQMDVALSNANRENEESKKKAGEPPDKRIEKLSERIARLEAENEVVLDENGRLVNKLEKAAAYILESGKALSATEEDRRKVAAQRDKALAKIKRFKDNEAQVEALTAANSDLQKQLTDRKLELERLAQVETSNKDLAEKLAAAEKKLVELAGGISKAEAKDLQDEIALLHDRLTASRQALAARDKALSSLATQLDESTGELARLRLNPPQAEEQKRLLSESQLLRQILVRQIYEESERNHAVADLEAELERLNVRSKTLASVLGILSNAPPVIRDEERALFRDPIAALKDAEVQGSGLSLIAVKEDTAGGSEALPADARKLAVEAVDLVKQRRFTDAEKKYQRIVEACPNNHFALANLAVTQIQAGKLSAARVALEKALSLKPDDAFASANLGNVYSRLGRFDDAISILDRAVALDPNNAIALNYLANALGKKGDRAKSEEVFRKCIEIDPSYANAHFNLAVMYVNAEPPSLQLARKHYEKAKALGAEPDAILEKRLARIESSN